VPLRFWTARLPHHGVPGYDGPGQLDVTRGTGGAYGGIFAPSRPLLDEANKRKRAAKGDEEKLVAAWAWYAPLYLAEMRASYRMNRARWDQLLARTDEPVLCCYCGTVARCHRTILAGILERLGAVHLGERPADPALTGPAPGAAPTEREPGEEG